MVALRRDSPPSSSAALSSEALPPPPPVVALVSGKGGVGRTSLALNLALSLGAGGRSVLVVDADPHPGHLALLAGVEPAPALFDQGIPAVAELSHDVDLIQVLPATATGSSSHPGFVSGALAAFEQRYDWLIVDTGPGIDATTLAAAWIADAALVVLTPDLTAVVDGYATLKALLAQGQPPYLGTIVNMVDEGEVEAQDLHEGFADLAMRFLGARIHNRGYIPFDSTVREAAKCQVPFCRGPSSGPAAAAIAAIVSDLVELHPIVTLHHRRAYLERMADLVSATLDRPAAMSFVQESALIV